MIATPPAGGAPMKETDKINSENMMRKIIIQFSQAIITNRENNRKKSKLINLSWYFLIAGLSSLIVFAFFFIGSNIINPKQVSMSVTNASLSS